MASPSPQAVWTGKAILGEGPTWSPRLGCVLFVDIKGSRLIAWSPADGGAREWPMAEPCCWLIERRDGDGFLAGLRTRIVHLRLDLETGPTIVREIVRPEAHLPGNRLNDAKADAQGRVWAGSMEDAESGATTGSLYRIDPDGRLTCADQLYGVANGPALSPDGRTLYHTDSAARTIFAFDLAADGTLARKRIHIRFGEPDGYPDGMTTDREGGLWVAHWDGARVTRFGPDGRADRVIALPCSRITSCVFFGPSLDRLAITSASFGRPNEALAGALFVADPGVSGLPPATYG